MLDPLSLNPDVVICLVISTKKGEFEAGFGSLKKYGTTINDLIIIKSMGFNNIIILLNKLDLLELNDFDFDSESNNDDYNYLKNIIK